MGKLPQGPEKQRQPKIKLPAQKNISRQGKDVPQRPALRIVVLTGSLIVVCAAVLATHWPALSAQAQSFDDSQYITDNLLVQNPGWSSTRRFFTEVLEPSTVNGYYQPLTMISLMVDYALGGRPDNLMPFHRTGLALHIINTALVIVLLYLLFGRVWIAAGAGLLFGLHPLTVELICWVSDRKDLLASFFALACLILYVYYTRRRNWKFYTGCIVLYILALMSKPTSLPLPVLMLLTDFWPLGRLNRRAILEKLPFFGVGAIFAVITIVSQGRTAFMATPGGYGYDAARIVLVFCHNIIFYLYKILWPARLSSFYPYPEPFGLSDPMVLAGVIGTCILVPLLLISLRWTPAILTGWMFFLVAIFPTMGIIGFTNVIAADRYTYLPSIGLLMILTWFLGWFSGTGKLPIRRVAIVMAILILAGGEAAATRRYLVHWQDTVSLCRRMLSVTPGVATVHNHLGWALRSQGNAAEAVSHYRLALQLNPYFIEAYNDLGIALQSQGKLDESIRCYRRALQLRPDYATAYYNLGTVFQSRREPDEAIRCYRQVLQLKPDFAKAHYNLGLMLQSQGKLDEAISHYRQALQLKPHYAEAHNGLGTALGLQGKLDEAVDHCRQAVQLKPGFAKAHCNLGFALQLQGKLGEAINCYRRALQHKPDFADAHYKLGNALQTQGRLEKAVYHWKQALQLKADRPGRLNELAWILATTKDTRIQNPTDAVWFARKACELTNYRDPALVDTLAAAYAAAGRFSEAVATAEKAIDLAQLSGQEEIIDQIRDRLHLYEAGQPYTEP